MSKDKMPTELDDYRQIWHAMTAQCQRPCGAQWTGVAPTSAIENDVGLECPVCHEMSGSVLTWDTEPRRLKDAHIEASLVDDGEP
jgi:hypothetical protein